MDIAAVGYKIGLFFGPFLFALCFHEFAHGFVAKMKGDRTAEQMGRLSLNPMAHIDLVGTVIFPLISIATGLPLFGWAKPVPVNPRNFSNPRNDMFWVALAGPLSNILLFVVGLFVAMMLQKSGMSAENLNTVNLMLKMFLLLNLYLAFFNLIPVHPLDGGKVLERFIPYRWNQWLEENQNTLNMILLVLMVTGGLQFIGYPARFLYFVGWIYFTGSDPSL